ncbi:MAG: NAD-dependent epimerase/dehydratase family protein [Proteobacteria bacterium]|nr:NAD-dependent epimerase/dehydratase family protein [Pseudomonadota bacterium]HQR03428.1 NAD-dependent epimerase/dehydratase family protein [Rhodocyclaceae bacterium]
MSVFITGVAGFIGCNLASELLAKGRIVAGFDNLCRGSRVNLTEISSHPNFSFEVVDLSDIDAYRHALHDLHRRQPVTEVWHLAANSDIPAGTADPHIDYRDTFMTTFNTLVLMRELGIPVIAFASSSAIYGDHGDRPLNEDSGPLLPISNYGAMKLAAEAAISAACESHLEAAYLFRFPNVIGVPATHGVIQDFMRKLRETPGNLDVLGDGSQQKGYLHVTDLVDAMLFIRETATDKLSYFNIGASDKGVTVRYIAETVRAHVAPEATLSFGQGNKGWVGDVPKFTYLTEKLSLLGWNPRLGSEQAIRRAVKEIARQEFGS